VVSFHFSESYSLGDLSTGLEEMDESGPENCFVKECLKELAKRKEKVVEEEVRKKCGERWGTMTEEEKRWFKILNTNEQESKKDKKKEPKSIAKNKMTKKSAIDKKTEKPGQKDWGKENINVKQEKKIKEEKKGDQKKKKNMNWMDQVDMLGK